MAEHESLLIELGTEELPPKALDDLAAAFLRGVCDGLAKRGVGADLDRAVLYASPRRLAVHIPQVATHQSTMKIFAPVLVDDRCAASPKSDTW